MLPGRVLRQTLRTAILASRPLSWLEADRYSSRAHPLLGLADAVLAVMEDRRAEDGVGAAPLDRVHQVVERPRAAGGDNRHVHGVGHRPSELQLVAVLGAVAIHAREQDLPRPALGPLARPFDRIPAGRRPAAVDVDPVAAVRLPACVYREDHALGAEHL